jgi:hypothetical protein
MAHAGRRGLRKHSDWRILYGAAVIETKSARLSEKVDEAEAAILFLCACKNSVILKKLRLSAKRSRTHAAICELCVWACASPE